MKRKLFLWVAMSALTLTSGNTQQQAVPQNAMRMEKLTDTLQKGDVMQWKAPANSKGPFTVVFTGSTYPCSTREVSGSATKPASCVVVNPDADLSYYIKPKVKPSANADENYQFGVRPQGLAPTAPTQYRVVSCHPC
jgi:hypothetical protein